MSRPEPQPNISSFDTLNSETDYEELYKQLENIPGINTVWRMKYYHLLFPTLLASFYGQDIQLKVLHFLKQNPSSIPFIRMGQIALFIKKCNIPGIVFDHIWGKYANDANTVDTSDTNTLSDKKRKPTVYPKCRLISCYPKVTPYLSSMPNIIRM